MSENVFFHRLWWFLVFSYGIFRFLLRSLSKKFERLFFCHMLISLFGCLWLIVRFLVKRNTCFCLLVLLFLHNLVIFGLALLFRLDWWCLQIINCNAWVCVRLFVALFIKTILKIWISFLALSFCPLTLALCDFCDDVVAIFLYDLANSKFYSFIWW